MREIQVVAALGHVIGELVADREAQPHRATAVRDDVQPDDLGLLTEIEREAGSDDGLAARDRRRDRCPL